MCVYHMYMCVCVSVSVCMYHLLPPKREWFSFEVLSLVSSQGVNAAMH